MRPAVGSRSRMMARPSVDLPQPDSPTRPTVSPALISRSTPSTACTWPVVRCINPVAIGNHTLRSLTVTSGWSAVQAMVRCLAAVSGTFQLRPRLGHPARRALRVPYLKKRGHVVRAAVYLEHAPGMEGAATRQVDQVRRQAFDRLQGLVALRVQAGGGGQQRPRIGGLRVGGEH